MDTKEKLEKNDLPLIQPSTSHEDETNWDNWTPTLRQPISEKLLVTTNKQNKFTKEKSLK